MRICLVSPAPPPYGGISHWTTLIHHYSKSVANVDIIQVDTAPRWRTIHDRGIGKRSLGGGLQFLLNYIEFIVALLKKPDVVHLTTSGSLAVVRDFVMSVSCKWFRIPLIYHIRFGRVPAIAEANTLEWRIMARVMRLASVTIAITPSTSRAIRETIPGVEVTYIPNPIDCRELPVLSGETTDEKIVLYLGWVIPTKGIEELVNSWSQLGLSDWRLLIVGPGAKAYQQELLGKYRPVNLEFLGELDHDQAMELMARCAVFVLPSHTEGFPNVILEAMALGKPIIATSVGAIPEMLAGDCGFLIEPKDIEGLKQALYQLTHDEPLRHRLGERAYLKVREEYSLDIIFARYLHVWQTLTLGGRDGVF